MADVPYLPYGEGVNPSNWVVNEDIDAIIFMVTISVLWIFVMYLCQEAVLSSK